MSTGDLDLGIVGYDMFSELAFGDTNLVVVHEALNFGKCHLGLGVPVTGGWASLDCNFLESKAAACVSDQGGWDSLQVLQIPLTAVYCMPELFGWCTSMRIFFH